MSSVNFNSSRLESDRNLFSQRFRKWLDRRIPPQRKVLLSQRNVFIFPSKTGLAFFILLGLLLFGAINYQNALIYGITFLLGSLFLVTIIHTYKNLAGLTFEFVSSRPGFVDENIEFQIKVSQVNGGAHAGIQLGWPSGLKQWAHLNYSDSDTVHLFVPAKSRGWMIPGRLLVETFYPLGLLRAWTWIDFGVKTLVYPKPLFQDPIKKTTVDAEEGEVTQRDGNDDFYEMRSYHEGDPIKHIAWRNYARSDELMVKQFAGHQEVQVILDWDQLHGDVENRLSRLTGMALIASRSNQEFGLLLPGVNMAPNAGPAHLDQVLTELALYGYSK